MEIPITHPGEEEDSDDEQKNVQPPSYTNSQANKYKSTGSTTYPSGVNAASSSYGGIQRVSVDSYEPMPSDLGGATATRTVSYKKTTSFKKTTTVPEGTETVTTTTTSPIETQDEDAGLLSDDQMIAFNFDD